MFRSNDYYLCIINFHFLFKAKKICIVLISCIVPCTSYLGSGENILPWCQQWASDTAKVGSDPILTYLYSPPGWPARGRDARCASAATISIGVLIAARCVASSPLLRRISGISPVSAAAILWYHRPGKVLYINPVWHPSSLRLDVPIISFIWHLLKTEYTSFPYFGVKLSFVCLMFAYRKNCYRGLLSNGSCKMGFVFFFVLGHSISDFP